MMKINNTRICNILRKRNENCESEYTIKLFQDFECPTAMARKLREDHWKIPVLGNTKSFPCHQCYIIPMDRCTQNEINHSIIIQLSDEYSMRRYPQCLTDGPYSAYLGSAIKEKVKKSLDIAVRTNYTKAVEQLYLMQSWFRRLGCKNLIELTKRLIEEKNL